jgi:hypothetical protein
VCRVVDVLLQRDAPAAPFASVPVAADARFWDAIEVSHCARMCVYMFVYVCGEGSVRMHLYVCVCICVCMHLCVCVCICVGGGVGVYMYMCGWGGVGGWGGWGYTYFTCLSFAVGGGISGSHSKRNCRRGCGAPTGWRPSARLFWCGVWSRRPTTPPAPSPAPAAPLGRDTRPPSPHCRGYSLSCRRGSGLCAAMLPPASPRGTCSWMCTTRSSPPTGSC